MKMTLEDKNEWIAALKSGDYVQGREVLMKTEWGVTTSCCLGVFCDLQAKKGLLKKTPLLKHYKITVFSFGRTTVYGDFSTIALPIFLARRLDTDCSPIVPVSALSPKHQELHSKRMSAVTDSVPITLPYLNDNLGLSFDEIADVLEKAIEVIPEYPPLVPTPRGLI